MGLLNFFSLLDPKNSHTRTVCVCNMGSAPRRSIKSPVFFYRVKINVLVIPITHCHTHTHTHSQPYVWTCEIIGFRRVRTLLN